MMNMGTRRRLSTAVMGHSALALMAVSIIALAFSHEVEGVSATSFAGRGRATLEPIMTLRGGSGKMTRSASQQDLSKPDIKRPGPVTKDARKEKIWQLTKQYKPVDKESIQRSAAITPIRARDSTTSVRFERDLSGWQGLGGCLVSNFLPKRAWGARAQWL